MGKTPLLNVDKVEVARARKRQQLSESCSHAPILTQLVEPSLQCSFFQMGALCFRVSMANLQAANASDRWGATHRHQHADFADGEFAGAVMNRYAGYIWPGLSNLCGNLLKDFNCHGFVSLVLQRHNGFTVGVVSYHTAHYHDCPIRRVIRQGINLI